jgi:hypothetical protein
MRTLKLTKAQAERERMWKAAKRRYIGPILTFGFRPPALSFYSSRLRKQMAKGRVIVHNQIAHTKDMPIGVNGFRCWTQLPNPKLLALCKCGWGDIEHYHVKGVGTHHSFTRKQLEARLGHPLWKEHCNA